MDSEDGNTQARIPRIREELEVGRRKVTTGKVRVRTSVEERVAKVRDVAVREDAVIERVAINQYVDQPGAPREEGDLLIVPVHREELVVTRRWLLTEELRIRRQRSEAPVEEEVVLREEQLHVERLPPESGSKK